MYMTNNLIDNARKQAMILGEQRGEQRGERRGMQQGIQRGMQQVIVNMLHNGVSIDQVVKLTSLDRKEVEQAAQAAKQPERDRDDNGDVNP